MKLAVIIPDSLNALVNKGELTSHYYNPGNIFDEIHLITQYEEKLIFQDIQKAAGNAKLYIHSNPKVYSFSPISFPAFFLGKWIRNGINLIKKINPELIRVHGHSYQALLGVKAAKQLSVPIVISIHTQPDISWRKRISLVKHPIQKLHAWYHILVENYILRSGVNIIAVYKPALDYAVKHRCKNVRVLYNCLNNQWKKHKTRYELHSPPRIIVLGRQTEWKDPGVIIRALEHIPSVELTLIGSGELHKKLITLSKSLKLENRCLFLPSINNDALCELLVDSDIFLHSSLYPEISKSTLEALLVGLPVIHNIDQKKYVQELDNDYIYKVENTVSSFTNAVNQLLEDDKKREHLGRSGYAFAQKEYAPSICESKYANLYSQLLYRKKNN